MVNHWKQNQFEHVDGMIGLSKSYYTLDGENSGSAFLEGLYQSGQIDSKIFAIHFDAFGGSELELGGYSPDKIV